MKRIATLATGVALVVPSSAAAVTSSTCQAYNPQTGCVTQTTVQRAAGGTLPFTGLDAALLAVGGGGLLGAGLAVRRVSRRVD
jgi:hypothetical protein